MATKTAPVATEPKPRKAVYGEGWTGSRDYYLIAVFEPGEEEKMTKSLVTMKTRGLKYTVLTIAPGTEPPARTPGL